MLWNGRRQCRSTLMHKRVCKILQQNLCWRFDNYVYRVMCWNVMNFIAMTASKGYINKKKDSLVIKLLCFNLNRTFLKHSSMFWCATFLDQWSNSRGEGGCESLDGRQSRSLSSTSMWPFDAWICLSFLYQLYSYYLGQDRASQLVKYVFIIFQFKYCDSILLELFCTNL